MNRTQNGLHRRRALIALIEAQQELTCLAAGLRCAVGDEHYLPAHMLEDHLALTVRNVQRDLLAAVPHNPPEGTTERLERDTQPAAESGTEVQS